MLSTQVLLVLALILLSTKFFGIISRRVHLPSVVGALLAGLLIGPACFNIVVETEFLFHLSEIGVIMLMFLAGLDTNIKELKKTGLASLVIAMLGVLIPLLGGFAVYHWFYDGVGTPEGFIKAVFIGVVLTATSISITVETLRELGHLTGRVGTTILGAAIIDDIIGIVVLTFVIGLNDSETQISMVLLKILGFVAFSGVAAVIGHFIFKRMYEKTGPKRRIAIYGIAFALVMAYTAENLFGVANITGAYFAGLILCGLGATKYIAKKINVMCYLIFAPVFFASVGIKASFEGFNLTVVWFSLALLVVAIITKVVGCGLGAKLFRFNNKDALRIGVGMVSRGEVALIVARMGEQTGILDARLFPAVVLVVVVTTLVTPILLRLVMPKTPTDPPEDASETDVASAASA